LVVVAHHCRLSSVRKPRQWAPEAQARQARPHRLESFAPHIVLLILKPCGLHLGLYLGQRETFDDGSRSYIDINTPQIFGGADHRIHEREEFDMDVRPGKASMFSRDSPAGVEVRAP
jgi:hypothetical protein